MSTGGARILVVDDEPQILRALRTSLRAAGYVVETAETAQAALAEAAMRPPDAVILETILPVHDGHEVLRRIRRSDRLKHVPVIVLSARKLDRDIVETLELGADDYVTKPFILDELVARVARLISRSSG